MMKRICPACAVLVLLPVLLLGCTSVRPPAQPLTGFGGSDYVTTNVKKQEIRRGGASFFVFEPIAPQSAPGHRAPVVLFLHGWQASNPALYGAWLNHLAQRGNVVIWPQFELTRLSRLSGFQANMMEAVQAAFAWLRERKDISVELDRIVVVGHSAGGILAANYAAVAKDSRLPLPRAVFAVQSGNTWLRFSGHQIPREDFTKIPSDTLLLVLQGDGDRVALDREGREIVTMATAVPHENKRLVVLFTDSHGRPKVSSSHLACLARDDAYDAEAIASDSQLAAAERQIEIEPQDYLVYWRLLDALIAAPAGCTLKQALGDEPSALDLGRWSDGTPIRRLSER